MRTRTGLWAGTQYVFWEDLFRATTWTETGHIVMEPRRRAFVRASRHVFVFVSFFLGFIPASRSKCSNLEGSPGKGRLITEPDESSCVGRGPEKKGARAGTRCFSCRLSS